MPFKSDKMRKALFAMDKDKQQNINPMQAKSQNQTINLKQPQAPMVIKPIKMGSLNPTSVPSLPGISKMPKFGRIKKYFKK